MCRDNCAKQRKGKDSKKAGKKCIYKIIFIFIYKRKVPKMARRATEGGGEAVGVYSSFFKENNITEESRENTVRTACS